MRVNSTSSARCWTRAWAAASAARASLHLRRQLIDIGLRNGVRFEQAAGAAEVQLGKRQFALRGRDAGSRLGQRRRERAGVDREEQLALPDDLAVREVDSDDLAGDARTHLDAAARLEAADIIVPQAHFAFRGAATVTWGVGGAAAGEGSLVQRVTAAARATRGVP